MKGRRHRETTITDEQIVNLYWENGTDSRFVLQNSAWYMVYRCLDPETGEISQLPGICAESGADFTGAFGVKVYDRYLVAAGNELGIRVMDLETGELRVFEYRHASLEFSI